MLQRKSKKKKKEEVRNVYQRWGQFCPNIFPTFHSNLERLYFEGGGEKICGSSTFLSLSPSQPNSKKFHFPPYFPLSIFHSPCFYPNQPYPKDEDEEESRRWGKVGLGNVNISCGAGSATFWVLNFNDQLFIYFFRHGQVFFFSPRYQIKIQILQIFQDLCGIRLGLRSSRFLRILYQVDF